MKRLFAIAVVGLVSGQEAVAATRSYSLPTQDGQAISACLANGSNCGKPAADAFCKKAGYAESILFAREPVSMAIVLDADEQCIGETCEAFTRIKCYSPKGTDQANAG
jgi:hypothetical protein